ncbi:hypothetical protein [Tenacibaculum finnmarkense]|uniref:hypothetical protein n=1 Tax=Tenacibaculum finnmarkense TaxID=2781243 RepID=UPI000C654D67|nr:hypothetical protein [Tenacibaculum finnmarkense]MBE7660702.1 hypothetical protein [Tenacibaculum finnmarkense genomovar finnmarkense]MCG8252969.1 hypothetical protein [Tenacibaculum finnmarkense genomovar finnmarkense]MCG8732196.1 hypothetical protein [Tenacibaculum finnmarkense]MCG8752821.1 hypothetical protein [Tenacibaculum finnmarkense]MCG8773697.1 hypothetical protein [Tenacibaculum finnmarkense]
MLRKLIVKYFALSYITKIFGKEIYMLRGATPLSVSFSLVMIGAILDNDYLYYTAFAAFIVFVYIGFIYFRSSKNSVKWDELDDVQKRIFYNIGIGFIDMLKSKEGYSLDNQKVHNSPIFLIINIFFFAAAPVMAMIF